MLTSGVEISKGKVGANRLGSDDGVTGLVMHGVAAEGIALGEVKELRQLADLEALGIDKAYDATNNVRVWYNIKEFYRMVELITGRKGHRVYILLIDNSLAAGDLNVTLEAIVEDAESIYCKKLINEAEGKIRLLGAVMNPAAGYISTILNGLDADVINAIPKAQLLADWAWDGERPLNILLEGREFNGAAAAAYDLRAIPDVKAENVSVSILQDFDYAEGLDAIGKKHAAVGTVLGIAAAISVHQHIGEVEIANIQDVARGAFIQVGFSSHELVKSRLEDIDTLEGKGYIFGFRYTDYDGVYLNGDHTCTPVEEDAEGNKNLHQLSYGRIIGKCKRKLRSTLLPKLKSTQEIDPVTGRLSPGAVKYLEGLGNSEFNAMTSKSNNRQEDRGNIVFGESYVNEEDSDLLNLPRTLVMDFAIIPPGTIDKIKGSVNLKSRL